MNFNDPQLIALRKKALNGSITKEEYKEAISLMREGRVSAHHASANSRKGKPVIDEKELFGDLFADINKGDKK